MIRQSKYISAAVLSFMVFAGASLYTTNAVGSQTNRATQNNSDSTKISYAPIPGGAYAIDPAHSSINFSIRHLLINNVRGRFSDYSGTITYNPDDITKSSVEFTAKVASVDTDIAKRDEHLRTADFFDVEKYPEMTFKSTRVERKGKDAFVAHGDFFDAEKYPEMTFKSTRIERKGKDAFVAHGDFTLHGVSKQVAIPFKIFGAVKDPWGGTRMGVEAATTINRQDYGLTFNQPMAEGGLMIANDVRIELVLEAVKQEPAKTQAAGE